MSINRSDMKTAEPEVGGGNPQEPSTIQRTG